MAPTHRGKDSIETRRSRGEISCAECRRHKLKCDRVIPCSSCVRKGCQSLCPNGTQITGHASRLGAANSEAFNRKIVEMGKRIRQLEDALQISHSSVSNAPHPLLTEDLLAIKSSPAQPAPLDTQESDGHKDLLDAFGTLSVTDGGTESYIGGADALLARHFGNPSFQLGTSPDLTSSLPVPISYLSRTFPFSPINLPVEEIQAYIEGRLPSYARASALVEAYLENLSWYLRPVDREQIMEELIPDVYRRKRQTTSSNTSTPDSTSSGGSSDGLLPVDAHALALLLIVFACGAVADLTLPPWNEEAELYYHLARTAISLKPVFEGAGLHAVQAITLIGGYDLFSCRKVELEGSWKVVTFAMSLAASIGLNRDPAHFKLSPKLIQRRRRVFWELYTIDVWKSIGSGRPVTFTPSVIDCEFPEDTDAIVDGDGSPTPTSIWSTRYRFVKEILIEVVVKLGTVRAVKYSEILALDHRIRDFCSKQIIRPPAHGHEHHIHDGTVMNVMKQVQFEMLKDLSLLMLHRNFFARALMEDSVNPMRTRFAPSFLATYRSSVSLLRLVRQQFECSAPFLMRLWPVWGHALAATVMLGAIAGCGTTSALAPQAFVEFELGVKMFAQVQLNPVVERGMPVLLGLRDQALQALSRHGNGAVSQQLSVSPTDPRSETQNEREERSAANSLGHRTSTGPGGEPNSSQGYTEFMRDAEKFVKRLSSQSIPGPSSGGAEIQNEQNPGPASDATTMTTALPLSSHAAQDSRGVLRHGPVEYENGATSQMQVDNSAYASMQLPTENAGSRAGSGHSFRPSPHYAYQTSPSASDLFNEFTTFSDMTVDSNVAGPSSGAGYPNMQAPAPVHPAFNIDALAIDSPSRLSLNMVFNSDFDVSYDMRASTGDASALSLLPDDSDSWRAILQDSRFFGTGEGSGDSERQMNL